MDDAPRICARLIREGAIARKDMPDLDHPETRKEVEQNLGKVGLVLATSAYSEHVGLRLSPQVVAEASFDSASNLGLRSDALALLVIAWAKLVLPKRTVRDTREVPGQGFLLTDDRTEAARSFVPQTRIPAIAREFGSILGGASHIRALVSSLRRLKFLGGRGDVIEPGPLLELGLDGDRLMSFIRREVLAKLLEDKKAEHDDPPSEEEILSVKILETIARAGGTAPMKDLVKSTGEEPPKLRRVLTGLIEAGKLKRTGERVHTLYHRIE
jgi:hypothetical protein